VENSKRESSHQAPTEKIQRLQKTVASEKTLDKKTNAAPPQKE
jgi:hypothetical protein